MESIVALLEQASEATIAVKSLSDDKKEDILRALAAKLRENSMGILAENQLDLDRMPDTDPKKDRLLLTAARIEDLAKSVEEIAALLIRVIGCFLKRFLIMACWYRKLLSLWVL